MDLSNRYEHIGDDIICVTDTQSSELSIQDVKFTIHPVFSADELSDTGVLIATNSLIYEEGILGCVCCRNMRPLELFETDISSYGVCEICMDICPNCNDGQVCKDEESIGCSNCDLNRP